jgi:hypothetical protein
LPAINLLPGILPVIHPLLAVYTAHCAVLCAMFAIKGVYRQGGCRQGRVLDLAIKAGVIEVLSR